MFRNVLSLKNPADTKQWATRSVPLQLLLYHEETTSESFIFYTLEISMRILELFASFGTKVNTKDALLVRSSRTRVSVNI